MMKIKFVIFHLYTVLEVVYGQEFIGDACTVQTSGAPGVCKFFSDCQPAIESLRKYNQTPQTCGFDGNQPIVCCPNILSNSRREPGEISKRKCREYVSYAYEDGDLNDNTTRILKNYCDKDRVTNLTPESVQSVNRKEFPHMAAIGYEPNPGDVKWLCEGIIISENYILTAANCLSTIDYGPAKYVRIGVTDLNDTNHRQELKIVELMAYPQYKLSSYYHVIGLIKLEKSAEMNPYARPACLYTKPNITGNNFVASGWDTTNWEDSHNRGNLMKIKLHFVDHKSCNTSYKNVSSRKLKNGIVNDIQICVGQETQTDDVCEPNLGGPLQLYPEDDQTNCMYDIVGIGSFGMICDVKYDPNGVPRVFQYKHDPNVYTRVSYYIKWIEDIVWPEVL